MTHLDLNDVDIVGELDGQIYLAMVTDVLGDDLSVKAGEEGVEDAGVIALGLRQVVVPEILPGDAGEEAADGGDEAGDIAMAQAGIKGVLPGVTMAGQGADPAVKEVVGQGHLYLLVGQPQPVEEPRPLPAGALDGQVTGLEQKGHRVDALDVEGIEDLLAGLHPFQVGQEGASLLEQLDEKAGAAGLEPVIAVLPVVIYEEEDVEGVVDRLAQKSIAVVPALELVPVNPGQMGAKGGLQVSLGITANGGEAGVEGQIVELIDAREQADLAELGHPGHEDELEVGVLGLQGGVKVFQPFAQFGGPRWLVDVVEDGLVVFVHQDNDALPAGLVGADDELGETAGQAFGRVGQAQAPRIEGQQFSDGLIEFRPALQHPTGEVEPDHRMAAVPVPALVDGQAPKEVLTALEQLLEGVQEQALAEAPGA